MRVYLDNCCYNRPFDEQANINVRLETKSKLYIQKQIRNGELDLIWSFIQEYENEMNPDKHRKESILKWRNIAKEIVEPNYEIESLAEEIGKTGIKSKDALHIACAIYSKCDYFITVDKRVLKYQTDKIKVINPKNFLDVLEV